MLLFADDILTESEEGLQSNLQVLIMSEAMGRWDLKVNWKKTNVMKVMKVMQVCYRLGFNVNCILRSICWGCMQFMT